jgi:hypothetical protein
MHNCKATQRKLIDLVFGEMQLSDRRQMLGELEACHVCQQEYRALSGTLRTARETMEAAQPDEEFWPGHHARMRARIEEMADAGAVALSSDARFTERLAAFARAFANASLRVPAPVAAALLVIFVASIIYAMYRRPFRVESQSSPAPLVETRTVEVPVVREKLVTRVVYVPRNDRRDLNAKARVRGNDREVPERIERDRTLKTPMTLAGFAPAGDVKVTVIKGSYHDEK